MKKIRISAAILALIMLALVFTSCGSKTKKAVMTIKNYGQITIELDYKNSPITAKHFEKLAKEGLLDGTDFIRMQEGFVLQGGANSKSTETIKGEFSSNGVNNKIEHKTGVISMARSSDPNSASTQFFIVLSDDAQPSLDGNYAAFGRITEGWDVIEKICSDIKANGGFSNDYYGAAMGFLSEENYIKIESVKMVD
ncbi:MAG: peptidylprolyl isomerase [Eubacterium sp.]|nr:peptidylprolyl isomerase [Eubacterium sp.]